MAKVLRIFACFVIIALDVAAGILAIQADAAQNKEKQPELVIFGKLFIFKNLVIFECTECNDGGFVMGLAAAYLLLFAHVLAILLGRSCLQLRKPSSISLLSVACFILTFVCGLIS